jgi:hypothetical protein
MAWATATKTSAAPGEDWLANEEGNNGQNKLKEMGMYVC